MERRTLLAALGLGAGTLTLGYALFAPASDEEQILAVLDALAGSISFAEPIANPVVWGLQLNGKLEELMSENVQVRIAEVRASIPSQRSKLGPAAGLVLQRYSSLDVTISGADITIQGETATVSATARVSGRVGGGFKSDNRELSFGLVRDQGDWRVHSVQAAAPD